MDVARHPEYGFYQLDPLPDLDELAAFYESGYYDLLRQGQRAPDLARLAAGGSEADAELQWLQETVFRDFVETAERQVGGRGRVLEIGSGRGDLLECFGNAGWECIGLEPATEVAEACRQRGLDVRSSSLAEFLVENPAFEVDAVVLRFVLEHVPDPVDLLERVAQCLRPGGALVVEVPNDFNDLQEAAVRKLGVDRWWIADPDHINYFDFDSLSRTLDALSFDVATRTTTFPMELFLLMGENFIGDADVGSACHRRRREFELSVDPSTRRRLYGALAEAGIGRSCLVTAARR